MGVYSIFTSKAIEGKCREKLRKGVFLHHVIAFSAEIGFELFEHLSCSPVLAPIDY